MGNRHTCPVCGMHLVLAAVVLMDGEAVEVTGQVIRSTRVSVPVHVDDVSAGAGVGDVA